jgi:hypothetical protein
MGGREMGYMGPGLPGQRSVGSADDRAFVEDQWGIPRGSLRTGTGTGTIDLFNCMAEGVIKRFWNPATGYDLRGAGYDRLRKGPLQWPRPRGYQ